MTIAVDGDVQRQFKETNKISYSMFTCPYFRVYVGKQNKFPVFESYCYNAIESRQ